MGVISIIWGVVAVLWMVLSLIPFLGWGNWFMIPFAAIGAIIAAIGLMFTRAENRGRAKAGLWINLIAIVALSGTVVKLTRDYFAKRARGEEPTFDASEMPELKGIDRSIWQRD